MTEAATRSATPRLRHVLVPIDGSPLAESVLPFVAGLDPDEVTLIQVVTGAEEREGAERALHAVADRLRGKTGAVIATATRTGRPADEIVAAAAASSADAIAMTSHGRSGFDALILGSVAARVIRAAPIPVLTLRAENPPADLAPRADLLSRVLVPHDGSELAGRALDAVARVAGGRRASVILFGVVETLETPSAKLLADVEGKDLASRYLRMQGAELKELLEKEAARARGLGLEAKVETAVGRPIHKILERERTLPASLLAVATHGRSGLAKWVLGSVTEKLLHTAAGPVLVCR